jgi:hypothetical protein
MPDASPWARESGDDLHPERNADINLRGITSSRVDGKPRVRLEVYLQTNKGLKQSHIDMDLDCINDVIRGLMRQRAWLKECKRIMDGSDA